MQCSSDRERKFENCSTLYERYHYNHDIWDIRAKLEQNEEDYYFDLSSQKKPAREWLLFTDEKKQEASSNQASSSSKASNDQTQSTNQTPTSSNEHSETNSKNNDKKTKLATNSISCDLTDTKTPKPASKPIIASAIDSRHKAAATNDIEIIEITENTNEATLPKKTPVKHKLLSDNSTIEAKRIKLNNLTMNMLARNAAASNSQSAFTQIPKTDAYQPHQERRNITNDPRFNSQEGDRLRLPISKNGAAFIRPNEPKQEETVFYNNVNITHLTGQNEKFLNKDYESPRRVLQTNSTTNTPNRFSFMNHPYHHAEMSQTHFGKFMDKSSVERGNISNGYEAYAKEKIMQPQIQHMQPVKNTTTPNMENNVHNFNFQQYAQYVRQLALAKYYQQNPDLINNLANQGGLNGGYNFMNWMSAANAMNQANLNHNGQSAIDPLTLFLRLKANQNLGANFFPTNSPNFFPQPFATNTGADNSHYAQKRHSFIPNEHENVETPSKRMTLPPKKRLVYNSSSTGQNSSPISFTSSDTPNSISPTPSFPQIDKTTLEDAHDMNTQDKSKRMLSDQPKKIKRCPHVWQFCVDLLESEKYNPALIKWLNKEKGIFKIVKPDQVAELWGAQKNRKTDKKMNYEKMARGMRYSRREGFFKKLDKEKNKPNEYGKQLVFQFSEKAIKKSEWKWSFNV